MSIAINRIVLVLFVASFALLSGCGDPGPEIVRVTGKVVFKKDFSPAQFGTIEFRSKSNPPVIASSDIAKDGSFELKAGKRDGTVIGMHQVLIMQVIGGPRKSRIRHKHGHEVANKYGNYRTTPLEVEVAVEAEETAVYLILEVDSKEE